MGALVTLELPADSPVLALPWIITVGPLGEEEQWEPVVCGPYERAHALSLAETVVADEELMAVVEPLMPHTSVGEIRDEITSAKAAAAANEIEVDLDYDEELVEAEFDAAEPTGEEEIELIPPPSAEEIRAGFARIAARLSS